VGLFRPGSHVGRVHIHKPPRSKPDRRRIARRAASALGICTALLQAEINIVQAYPLLVRPRGRAAVALMVDNIEIAQETLAAKGFNMVTEADLQDEDQSDL